MILQPWDLVKESATNPTWSWKEWQLTQIKWWVFAVWDRVKDFTARTLGQKPH